MRVRGFVGVVVVHGAGLAETSRLHQYLPIEGRIDFEMTAASGNPGLGYWPISDRQLWGIDPKIADIPLRQPAAAGRGNLGRLTE